MKQVALGSGETQTWAYNERLQPTQIQAGNLMTLGFTYETSDDNNGNVLSQTITRNGAPVGSWNYVYDAANRLKEANSGAAGWTQEFSYDAFGNRAQTSSPILSETPTAFSIEQSCDRLALRQCG